MVEALSDAGGILSGIVVPILGATLYFLRRMVRNEVVPQLTNGERSVATYAREARDLSEKALAVATTVDARQARLEQKLDAHILGSEHRGSVAE